jgi:hypothetical protein
VLSGLNFIKMVWEFSTVDDYDLEPVRSVYDHLLEALLHVANVNNVLEQKLTSVEKDLYQMVVSQLVASATSGFYSSLIFFTDGSKSVPETRFCLTIRELSGVFTQETFLALIEIRALRPGRYLILTDRMSSLKALWTRRVSSSRWYMKSRKPLLSV